MLRIVSIIFIATLLVSGCGTKQNKVDQANDSGSQLRIVPRSEWGWQQHTHKSSEHTIKYITIHHGGVEFKAGKDPEQYLRTLQNWSRKEKKWIDIPYHYMIDLNGTIYEARPIQYPGDTNTEYDVRGHALISVIGNYEIQQPSEKQLVALAEISLQLAKLYKVDFSNIKTHRDYTETACPGKNLYSHFSDGSFYKRMAEYTNRD